MKALVSVIMMAFSTVGIVATPWTTRGDEISIRELTPPRNNVKRAEAKAKVLGGII